MFQTYLVYSLETCRIVDITLHTILLFHIDVIWFMITVISFTKELIYCEDNLLEPQRRAGLKLLY